MGTTLGKVLKIARDSRAVLHTTVTGGTPRIIAIDPVTGYAVVPDEAGGWVERSGNTARSP